MNKEFNCVYFGRLHKCEQKPGKNGNYWMIVIRNDDTFQEFRFTSYNDPDLRGLSIGDEVSLFANATQKGFTQDVRFVSMEKVSA